MLMIAKKRMDAYDEDFIITETSNRCCSEITWKGGKYVRLHALKKCFLRFIIKSSVRQGWDGVFFVNVGENG